MIERLQNLGYTVLTKETEYDITYILIKNDIVTASFVMDKEDLGIWHIDYHGSYYQLEKLMEELKK